MKFKISTLALVAIIAGQVSAQNTFPSTGNVGIGTTTPTSVLNLVTQGSLQANHNSQFDAFSGAVTGTGAGTAQFTCSQFNMRKARGTKAAPTAVVNGDRLSTIVTNGYDGSAYQSAAQLSFFVDGAVSAGVVPMSMVFQTGSNPATRADRLVVSSTGKIGINTAPTGDRLYVREEDAYSTAIYGLNAYTGSADNYGVFGNTTASTPGYGIGAGGTGNYMGGSFYNDGSSYLYSSYGVYASSNGSAGSRYGVYGTAYNSGETAVGVYGSASGATNNWAGYFAGQTFVGTPPTSPTALGTLHVENNPTTPTSYTGYFSSTYVGNTDTRGIYANAVNNPGWGYGGEFVGGWRGVNAYASPTESSVSPYGGNFSANNYGTANSSSSYGVSAYAYTQNTTGSAYGLYGSAGAGTAANAWALYASGRAYSTSGTWTGSDARLKNNIKNVDNAMSLISRLQPKTYEYRQDGLFAQCHFAEGTQYGFLAQDLEQVIPEAVASVQMPFNNLDEDKTNDVFETYKAVNYQALIPVLTKGMQEQQAVIEKQNETIDQLKGEIAAIKAALSQSGVQIGNTNGVGTTNQTQLFQNVPNPFDNTTTIPYFIADGVSSAKLIVTNAATGQVVETQTLATKGNAQARISAAGLSNGTYTYSLVID